MEAIPVILLADMAHSQKLDSNHPKQFIFLTKTTSFKVLDHFGLPHFFGKSIVLGPVFG
jgi:hypothetical protein